TAGITAAGVHLSATDSSGINAVGAAASIAAALGAGAVGVSAAIGLSLSFNEVSNDVGAVILNAGHGVTATSGDVTISAVAVGQPLFDLDQSGLVTAANLDDAANADLDDPNQPGNQAAADAQGDQAILGALRSAFAAQGTDLAVFESVATASMYTTADTHP